MDSTRSTQFLHLTFICNNNGKSLTRWKTHKLFCSFFNIVFILFKAQRFKSFLCWLFSFSKLLDEKINFSYRLLGGRGGGQLSFGEMRSFVHWEYCVEVSQRQHSLQRCVPQKINFTDFWWFIVGKQVMSLIRHTVLTVLVECGKWKRSLQYYISLLKFKFTRETLCSVISKFTILSVRLWSIINT